MGLLKPLLKDISIGNRILPSLALRFADNTYQLDSGSGLESKTFAQIITFTRASGGGRFNSSGVYEWLANDAPRLDYDPVTLQPKGLLIEEQRTNLLTYSEQFDNAAWTKGGATIGANVAVSPDGTASADKLIEDTSVSTSHRALRSFAAITNAVYTYSVFLKKDTRTWACLNLFDGTNTWSAFFNLATGAVGTISGTGTTAKIESVGSDWFRCSVTATGAFTQAVTSLATGDNGNIYTGDGTSGIYIWGAQLEVGSFPTSYIPTTTAQVTRAADIASVNVLSPWFNASEGTLFVEGSRMGTSLTALCGLSDTTASNRVLIRGLGPNDANLKIVSGGVNVADISTGPFPLNQSIRFALGLSPTSIQLFSAGVLRYSAPMSGAVPVTRLHIGTDQQGTGLLNGHIRNISYYPRAYSGIVLQEMTR